MRGAEKGTLLAPTYHWTLFRARYGEACLINPIYTQWVNMLKISKRNIILEQFIAEM